MCGGAGGGGGGGGSYLAGTTTFMVVGPRSISGFAQQKPFHRVK